MTPYRLPAPSLHQKGTPPPPGGPQNGAAPINADSIHALKRSAIQRRISCERSAKSATRLLFPIRIVTFKRRIAVSGARNRKPRHSFT